MTLDLTPSHEGSPENSAVRLDGDDELNELIAEAAPIAVPDDPEIVKLLEGPDDGPLSHAHLRELLESALTLSCARRAGLYTERSAKRASDLLGARIRDDEAPVLVFPVLEPGATDPVAHRVKLAKPRVEQKVVDGVKVTKETGKYIGPPRETHLYFPPALRAHPTWLTEPRIPLIVVEGEKKALAVERAFIDVNPATGKLEPGRGLGYAVVGIAGVDCWSDPKTKNLHRHFNIFSLKAEKDGGDGRVVFIVYDDDTKAKKRVRDARARFAAALARRGALPRLVDLPSVPSLANEQKKTGADDYLRANGPIKLRFEIRRGYPWKAPETNVQAGIPTTSIELARMYVASVRARARYLADSRTWVLWNGRTWAADDKDRISALTQCWLVDVQLPLARKSDVPEYVKLVARTSSASGVNALIELARENPDLVAVASDFDREPHLLSVANGVVDLRTGALVPHEPSQMITRMIDVAYRADARSAEWDAFLGRLILDAESRGYLQRAVGYSATGDTRLDRIFLLVGATNCGKSTFVRAIAGALGPYYSKGALRSFVSKRDDNPNAARSDLVEHVGKRFISASEIQAGQTFDLGLLKDLAGGERYIQLRTEYRATTLMEWVGKLWLVCNDTDFPKISYEDNAIWRRLVPFALGGTIPERERDEGSEGKLGLRGRLESDSGNRAAVLAWIVEGARSFLQRGTLGELPTAMRAAIDALRMTMEGPTACLRDQLAYEPGATIAKQTLYSAYKGAAEAVGEKPVSARKFIAALRADMQKAGVELKEGKSARGDGPRHNTWVGVRLNLEPADNELDDFDALVGVAAATSSAAPAPSWPVERGSKTPFSFRAEADLLATLDAET